MIKLSYIHSKDFVYNIERSLSLIKTEVTKGLKGAKKVVVKVELPTENNKQIIEASALEAVLAFLKPHCKNQITLVGQAQKGNTLDLFKNLGYLEFQDSYDFAITDLNDDELIKSQEEDLLISSTILQSDFLVLLSKPLIINDQFYGALPNIIRQEKQNDTGLFQKLLNKKNDDAMAIDIDKIKRTFSVLKIGLSVIDAHHTLLNKNGTNDVLPTNFAVASTHPVEADVLTSMCLGFDHEKVDYLKNFAPQLSSVFVVGDDWNKYSLTQ